GGGHIKSRVARRAGALAKRGCPGDPPAARRARCKGGEGALSESPASRDRTRDTRDRTRDRAWRYGVIKWTGLPRMFTSQVVMSWPVPRVPYSIFHQPPPAPGGSPGEAGAV